MRTSFTRGLNFALIVSAGLFAGGCKNNSDEKMETVPADSVRTTPTPGNAADTAARSSMQSDSASMAGSSAMSDANILAVMGMADSMEVAEGKLVQGKAKSADVKKFGAMMVTDHSKMMSEGKALATKLNVVPAPPAGDNMKSEGDMAMQTLMSVSGTTFDSAYVAMAVADHQKVLDKLNQMRGQAKSPDLVAAIDKAIPVVQHHLDGAKTLQGKMMKSTTSTADTTKKM
jgi:putative membrane protein